MRETRIVVLSLESGIDAKTQHVIVVDDEDLIASCSC